LCPPRAEIVHIFDLSIKSEISASAIELIELFRSQGRALAIDPVDSIQKFAMIPWEKNCCPEGTVHRTIVEPRGSIGWDDFYDRMNDNIPSRAMAGIEDLYRSAVLILFRGAECRSKFELHPRTLLSHGSIVHFLQLSPIYDSYGDPYEEGAKFKHDFPKWSVIGFAVAGFVLALWGWFCLRRRYLVFWGFWAFVVGLILWGYSVNRWLYWRFRFVYGIHLF